MRRGTTPTIVLHLPFDVSEIRNCEVYLAQGMLRITKTMSDCILEGNTIALTLTQRDTLMLRAGNRLELQARFVFTDGSVDASNIISISVRDILSEAEIIVPAESEVEPEPEGGESDGN